MACSTTAPESRSTSPRSRASSAFSPAVALRRPGFDASNAAIAPSRATRFNVMIVERSTPASIAAWTVVIWPVSIRTHRSYFCSADKNRFLWRSVDDIRILLHEVPTPSQLLSERNADLAREGSGNPLVVAAAALRPSEVLRRLARPVAEILIHHVC